MVCCLTSPLGQAQLSQLPPPGTSSMPWGSYSPSRPDEFHSWQQFLLEEHTSRSLLSFSSVGSGFALLFCRPHSLGPPCKAELTPCTSPSGFLSALGFWLQGAGTGRTLPQPNPQAQQAGTSPGGPWILLHSSPVCLQICHIFPLIRKGSQVFAHLCARRDCPGGLKMKCP